MFKITKNFTGNGLFATVDHMINFFLTRKQCILERYLAAIERYLAAIERVHKNNYYSMC